MKVLARSLLLVAAFAAVPAAAQWYAGIAAGRSKAQLDAGSFSDQFLDLGFDSAAARMDDTATGSRFHVGYRLHRHAALEAGAFDMGRFTVGADVQPAGSFDARIRSRGGDISALGLWGFRDASDREWLTAFARVGAYAARTRIDLSSSGSVMVVDEGSNETKRNSGLVAGVGLRFPATDHLAFRLEFTHYDRLGRDPLGGEFDVRLLSAGIEYRF